MKCWQRSNNGLYPRYETPVQRGMGCFLQLSTLVGAVMILGFLALMFYYNNFHTGALLEPSGLMRILGNIIIILFGLGVVGFIVWVVCYEYN